MGSIPKSRGSANSFMDHPVGRALAKGFEGVRRRGPWLGRKANNARKEVVRVGEGYCNRMFCPSEKRVFPTMRSKRTWDCCRLCICTKLRVGIALLSVIVGLCIGYGLFAFIFSAGPIPPVFGGTHPWEGSLRGKYEQIRDDLLSASGNWISTGLSVSQKKYLNQERELLCVLSVRPCSPFPSSWDDRFEDARNLPQQPNRQSRTGSWAKPPSPTVRD